MKQWRVVAVGLTLFFTSLSSGLLAQQAATSSLGGRVVDPQGVIVSGAQVTILQKATGFSRETVANADGLFRVNDLIPPTRQPAPSIERSGPRATGRRAPTRPTPDCPTRT